MWAGFSYKIIEAIMNEVKKRADWLLFQCWVYQENYYIWCGVISFLFRHSKKGDINKDRWPFVLHLNKKLKNQFQMQQFNQLKHNEVPSCTIHAHMHDSWVHVSVSSAVHIYVLLSTEAYQNKTKPKIRKCIKQPSDIIWCFLTIYCFAVYIKNVFISCNH